MPCEEWIRANARLIDDVSAEQRLKSLLEVLEGDYSCGEDGAAFGFRLTPPGRSWRPTGPSWATAVGWSR